MIQSKSRSTIYVLLGPTTNLISHFQTVSSRDPEDGKCGGPKQADLVFTGVTGTHLPLVGQHSRVDEHGDSCNAARVQNSRRSRPIVGFGNSER